MIVSNTGFFYQHFTPKTCARYHCVPIVFKGTVPLFYAVREWRAEPSCSIPSHGIAGNPGYTVGLDYSVLAP